MQEFKDVVGFSGLYSISGDGVVFSHKKIVRVGNQTAYVERGGFPLRQYKHGRSGHLRVYLAKAGKKYPRFVHRLVAEAFIPNAGNLPFINHRDGNPQNNCVSNLEWVTPKQNSVHAQLLGLNRTPCQTGTTNSNAKLCENDIISMRAMRCKGEKYSSIALIFGVTASHVSDICHYRRWSHVAKR